MQRSIQRLLKDVRRPHPAPHVTPLRCTVKSQVFLARWDTESLVAKLFSSADDYVGELYALTLLGQDTNVVRLLEALDERKLLLLEYLPDTYPCSDPEGLEAVAECLATIHASSLRWNNERRQVTIDYCLASLRQTGPVLGLNVQDTVAWNDLMAIMVDVAGDCFVPIALMDLKADHIRGRVPGGAPVFLDLETLALGVPGLVDLLALPWVAGVVHLDERRAAAILQAYTVSSARSAMRWRFVTLREALVLTCRSLGLAPRGWGKFLDWNGGA